MSYNIDTNLISNQYHIFERVKQKYLTAIIATRCKVFSLDRICVCLSCRKTDNITITTALLPFLDVNKKVSYKRSDSDIEHQYVISSISHDFAGFTSTITMYRFYPLYETMFKESGTHKALSTYTHGALSRYKHDELTKIMANEGW